MLLKKLLQKNHCLPKSCLQQLYLSKIMIQLLHLVFVFTPAANLVTDEFSCQSDKFKSQSYEFNSQRDEFIYQQDEFICQRNSTPSTINFAGSHPLGNRMGQKGADSHWGTTNVPKTLVFWACLITLGTRHICGNHQLFSPTQSQVNAFIASETGAPYLELNRFRWALWALENLSIVWGPI